MAKIIEGNLILDKDTVFDESLEVHGSILGKNGKRYNLTVNGNISARDMSTWDITARNITADDITADDITAEDIKAKNLDTLDISTKNLDTLDISARNITARNLDACNISATNITVDGITANDITVSGDITALDITALDITAKNLDAWYIKAKNLDTDLIICEKLEQKPGSTLNAKKVINNQSSYNRSAIDNSQFIKQEKCDACGQVRRGKESDKLLEKLK